LGIFSKNLKLKKRRRVINELTRTASRKQKQREKNFPFHKNLPLQFEYKITGYLKMALVEIFLPSFKTQKATTISTKERTYHELHLP